MAVLIINGEPVSIPHTQWADFHGKSVFTTLRSQGGMPVLWERHWARLSAHAQFFGYHLPDEQEVLTVLTQQLACAVDQKIRLIIKEHDYALTLEPYEAPASSIYRGVRMIISAMKPHPQLGQFKTGNYLPYSLALQEAQQQGAFEALMLDHAGYVVDGARTSIMVFDGTTLTACMGGLLGCMREEALAYAQQIGITITRAMLKPHEISGQLVLANSLLGLVPVGEPIHDTIKPLIHHFRMS